MAGSISASNGRRYLRAHSSVTRQCWYSPAGMFRSSPRHSRALDQAREPAPHVSQGRSRASCSARATCGLKAASSSAGSVGLITVPGGLLWASPSSARTAVPIGPNDASGAMQRHCPLVPFHPDARCVPGRHQAVAQHERCAAQAARGIHHLQPVGRRRRAQQMHAGFDEGV